MGNSEEGKSSKPDKPSSPVKDQTNIHVYPGWAAIQAYYGHSVVVPPYFNSAVASGHAPPPYMWGPSQPMMPPYAAPYAAICAPGGVYAHPSIPLGSSHGYGVPLSPAVSEAMAAPSLRMDKRAKSSGNTDQGLLKKLKGFDGLAMPIGNGNSDNAEGGAEHGLSSSGETVGSSNGSDGYTGGAGQNGRKRSREGTPDVAGHGKTEAQSSSTSAGHGNGSSQKGMAVSVVPASVAGKVMGTILSPGMTTTLELRNPSSTNVKSSPTGILQPDVVMPNEAWLHNEQELKRERRKQSNRDSARRSRLRKQAEAGELAMRVESLTAENMKLKSEITRLRDNSEKLKLENATLMERVKNARLGQLEETALFKLDDNRALPLSTQNLLSRVDNSDYVDRNNGESEMLEKNSWCKAPTPGC